MSRFRRRGLTRGLRDGALALLVVLAVVAAAGGLVPDRPLGGVRTVAQFPQAPQQRLADLTDPADRPNVVFVLTDDQNPDELRWMPHTQRLLLDRGISFEDNVSPHPLCCPARAELLTGQYAQNNGVRHNGGPHGGFQALAPATATLPERFAAAGYRTGLVGKYLNGYERGDLDREPGWDLWDPLVRGIYTYTRYTFGGEQMSWQKEDQPYVTDSIARRTNSAVRRMAGADEPFMLFSWHVAPHYRPSGKVHGPPPSAPRDRGRFRNLPAPSLAKPSYNQADVSRQPLPIRTRPVLRDGKNIRMFRGRVRSLQAVDRAVRSLVRTLRETGELDNTYIVYSSDNGYAMGEHRLFGKNVLTREIMDVPLVARGPGIPAGATSSTPSSLIDLPATLLDLAGIEDTDGVDGTSLLGPMLGRRTDFRDTMLVQTGGRQLDGWAYRGVQTARYLYAVNAHTDDGMLYDHDTDPHELDNLIDDPRYAGVVAELEDRAVRLRGCAGLDCNLRFGPEPRPRSAR